MHSPHDILGRDGIELLPPAQGPGAGFERRFMKCLYESAALVGEDVRLDDKNAGKWFFNEFHGEFHRVAFSDCDPGWGRPSVNFRDVVADDLNDIVEHGIAQAGIGAKKDGLFHDFVGTWSVSDDTKRIGPVFG